VTRAVDPHAAAWACYYRSPQGRAHRQSGYIALAGVVAFMAIVLYGFYA
jgi:hypothetical protein